ncbi:DUF4376 domain-containing protein [Pseudomonas asturiensis]|uniref:DUF4376 domain-containing protein n=1 Tax=Pseudomonas asturiensis TaxID=1190415 RepID=A0ABX6H6X2_9PSED|nr:DUF4376 domain-containing protein [Pseudomonas asturiensis]QHF01236.1 DUF4376 domain-containing protein [Pseudomonas asturiensis]
MYMIETFENGSALVVNTDPNTPYRAVHNAADEAEAERLVIEMNQPGMLRRLAEYRLSFEIGGLQLADGLRVLTDRESQGQLTSSYTTLANNLIPDTNWKAANGWQVVTLKELEPIAKAVAAHVRGCFRGENAVFDAINGAKTMAAIEAIDIPAQFAAAYQVAYAEVMGAAQ